MFRCEENQPDNHTRPWIARVNQWSISEIQRGEIYDVTWSNSRILAEVSRKYTAFLFNGKNYQFRRLPFGLNTSVASFIKCLDQILKPKDLDFLTVYVDDILIASRTFEDHLDHLGSVSYTHLDVYKRQILLLHVRSSSEIFDKNCTIPENSVAA